MEAIIPHLISFQLPGPTSVGVPSHPWEIGARFLRFWFVSNDGLSWMNKIKVSSTSSPIVITMNGIPRTVVSNAEEVVGGRLFITLEEGSCQTTRNPAVDFTGFET